MNARNVAAHQLPPAHRAGEGARDAGAADDPGEGRQGERPRRRDRPLAGRAAAVGGDAVCDVRARSGRRRTRRAASTSCRCSRASARPTRRSSRTIPLAVLHLSGVITTARRSRPARSSPGRPSRSSASSRPTIWCRGLVVRVNSPGGSGTASEAILLALRSFAEKKPVVVSMGSVAASGGYYVSMVGGTVFAEHNTITGSIGVFGMRPNVEHARAPHRRPERGRRARRRRRRSPTPFRPLQDAQLGQIESFIREFYGRFRAPHPRGAQEPDRRGAARDRRRTRVVRPAGARARARRQARRARRRARGAQGEGRRSTDLPVATYPEADAQPAQDAREPPRGRPRSRIALEARAAQGSRASTSRSRSR